ncbi:hypothetical protein [Candidatus Nitrotoga sp. M5]|uniref:hypothetical protein n=1 Tax=Candidatus Nitrotoga sp. M5 TaxID=2890409 RepID=UPI001EF43EE3|nr:hypothetical protein [Candidatus Nitrotoga sp. M5]CAH1387055.1 hypothetical protein NTGM5_480051 [Candidatus Nitrotoga sp. M5]
MSTVDISTIFTILAALIAAYLVTTCWIAKKFIEWQKLCKQSVEHSAKVIATANALIESYNTKYKHMAAIIAEHNRIADPQRKMQHNSKQTPCQRRKA